MAARPPSTLSTEQIARVERECRDNVAALLAPGTALRSEMDTFGRHPISIDLVESHVIALLEGRSGARWKVSRSIWDADTVDPDADLSSEAQNLAQLIAMGLAEPGRDDRA